MLPSKVSTYALIEVSGVRSSCDTCDTKSDFRMLALCSVSIWRSSSRIFRSSESYRRLFSIAFDNCWLSVVIRRICGSVTDLGMKSPV